MTIFYHSRLTDKPTGTICESLYIVVLVVPKQIVSEKKVLNKLTPISRTIYIKLVLKMYALYYTDV